ncbi:MAG: SDR family NAD(P)-dependent oxidoreductase [Clostridia bacterium]|nr:SDR family NAD(P)-dependent oxidoreductase [Clostridia bacterium]
MVAVVTGAGSGIGLCCVAKLLARDYYVVALVHNQRGEDRLLDSLAKKNVKVFRLYIVHADFCFLSEINNAIYETKQILKKIGENINCIINCAGIYSQIGHLLKEGEDMHAMVNFIAPVLICSALKKFFSESQTRIFCLIPNFKTNYIRIHLKNGFKYTYLKSKLDLAMYFLFHNDNNSVFLFMPANSTTDFYTKHTFGVVQKIGQIKKAFSMPPEYSAEQIVLLASRPEFSSKNTFLYKGLNLQKLPKMFFKNYKDGKKYGKTVEKCLKLQKTN